MHLLDGVQSWKRTRVSTHPAAHEADAFSLHCGHGHRRVRSKHDHTNDCTVGCASNQRHVIGETRDRGSESKLGDLLNKLQRAGTTIYTLNYSAWLTPFTAKPGDYTPPNGGDANYAAAFTEIARLGKKNTVEALTRATGGRRIGFETQSKLENDLIGVGGEIHSRYLISFTPEQGERPSFHKVEVKVRDRPDAIVKARPGYWTPLMSSQ